MTDAPRMPLDAAPPAAPCAFMAVLVELLGEMPAGRDRGRADAVAERLDRLEYDARWHDAPEATMAAIKGARVLLELAELPPLPKPHR